MTSPVIRPRCQDDGKPAHKSIERAGDGKVEYYCADCVFMKFNTQAPPRPVKEKIAHAVSKFVVLGAQ